METEIPALHALGPLECPAIWQLLPWLPQNQKPRPSGHTRTCRNSRTPLKSNGMEFSERHFSFHLIFRNKFNLLPRPLPLRRAIFLASGGMRTIVLLLRFSLSCFVPLPVFAVAQLHGTSWGKLGSLRLTDVYLISGAQLPRPLSALTGQKSALYGTATRRPWRTHTRTINDVLAGPCLRLSVCVCVSGLIPH